MLMKKIMRLDRVLANMGFGTRKEVNKMIRAGEVTVNGQVENQGKINIDAYSDEVVIRGVPVRYREHIYLMLNKPKGFISSTEDSEHRTVVEILEEEDLIFEPHPVGRLDLDTTGLLLMTNDGKLTHALTSPRREVWKTYIAHVDGRPTGADIEKFEEGLDIGDEKPTLPAKLEILSRGRLSTCKVSIVEGRYHQVKRMFQAIGMEVVELKRVAMGPIELDPRLEEGWYRELTDEELELLGINPGTSE